MFRSARDLPGNYERLVALLEESQAAFYSGRAAEGARLFWQFRQRLGVFLRMERALLFPELESRGTESCRSLVRALSREQALLTGLAEKVSGSFEAAEDPMPGLEALYTMLDAHQTARSIFLEPCLGLVREADLAEAV
jgi:hypothetical protein